MGDAPVTNVVHAYPRGRWALAALGQDLVLVAALVLVVIARLSSGLAIALGVAIPVVLAWGVATLHFPRVVSLDDEGVSFGAYGRVHRFAWRDVRAVKVRRFLVRDRVLVRIVPSPPWRGRYWILDSIEGFEGLVIALQERGSGRRIAPTP